MSKRFVVVIAIALHVLANSVNAAVLCRKRAGGVFIREACQKREQVVDPNGLGLKGDAGAPGEARAYGCSNVSADGTLVATCTTRPSKNIVSIVAASQQDNATCFVLDPSIDAAAAVVLVSWNENSFTSSGPNIILTVESAADVVGCPPNSVKVGTGRTTFTGSGLTSVGARIAVNIAVM